ncbi:MAG: HAMP domain-containing sensor histidine kinase [Rhodocyclaceae bacterium]
MTDPQPQTTAPATGRWLLHQQITAEQVSLLLRTYLDQFPALVFVAPALVAGLWGQVPGEQLLLWAVAYCASVLERRWFAARYFRSAPGAAEARRWGQGFAARAALGGLLIGAVGCWMFTVESVPHRMFVFAFLFLVSAGAPLLYAAFLPAFYAYLPGVMLPMLLWVVLAGALPAAWSVVGMTIYALVLLQSGRGYNEAIRRSFELRLANADLVQRLTRKNREAERADAAKSRFLTAASHDLRQPLQSLSLLSATLALRLGEGEERQLVRGISSSVETVQGQFAALMDISRLDAGLVSPEYRDFPLAPLLAKLAGEFAPVAAAKGLSLRVGPCGYWVRSDADLLQRTLRSLLANAIHYTDRGAVMVLARWRRAGVEIEVRDSGIGIAPEQQEYVFEEFFQLNNPARDRRKGMGLGLAIAKRVADLLGHPLRLRSAAGRGSVFSVLVPRSAPVAEIDRIPAQAARQ